jgi:hypothetical protein
MRVHVDRGKGIIRFRLSQVVAVILNKSECAFIDGVDECCEISIKVSDHDTSTLEGDFNSLNVSPQGDNTFAIVELFKASTSA